jgi:hypothetical protein
MQPRTRQSRFPAPLALLALAALALLALPAASLASPSRAGAAVAKHRHKHRCRAHRHAGGAMRKRACKRRRPPVSEVPPAPPAPPAPPSSPGGSGGGGKGEVPEAPRSEYELVDLISNNGFEEAAEPTSCFAPFSGNDGSLQPSEDRPLAGQRSLQVSVSPYGRVGCIHEYGFEAGPVGKSVAIEAQLRVDGVAAGSSEGLEVCAVVYFENDPQNRESCQVLHAGFEGPLKAQVDAEGKRLQRVFFQLHGQGHEVEVTLDDAHLWVERLKGSEGPRGGGGGGGGGGTDEGRYAAMVSPTDGETFTTPLNLRLVGIGHDPNIFTNEDEEHHPAPGRGTNAAKVEFFLDGDKIFEQAGKDAEYHVFKGFAENLDVAPGQHEVWAVATYKNPALELKSPVVTITVESPPAYARTVDLTEDVVLSASQSYELEGAPGAPVRLNGNGHRIVAPGGTSGHLNLKYVDVYDLGDPGDTSSPGIDVTATGSTGSVAIEHSTFDSSNPVALRLDGSATASIRGNLFRSNMRMPIGQLPEPEPEPASGTTPVIQISGSSTAPKTFAANDVGAAPVLFQRAHDWMIGGTSNADSNVLIGPRAAFEVVESSDMTIEGNFVDHNYYGGWSQGQLLELRDTRPITVEHNVLMDSSWPVRGIAGEFAYNLVLEAGHQWMVPDDGAYVHHNVFVGGDNDQGGITGYYPISARIEDNTFDGQLGSMTQSALRWEMGQATLRSNAFIDFPTRTAAVVDREGGTIDAAYNGFFNPQQTDYIGVTATNDLNGGASTDPRFAGPLPRTPFEMDKAAVWKRQLTVGAILAAYRAFYTPTQGSPYIDAGDPAGGPGNDIGAVGAGAVSPLDRFGSFSQPGWTPPPTPPSP